VGLHRRGAHRVDRVRRATLQRLRKEWENLSFHPGEHIEDFALRLATLKQQMILHGKSNMDEERAVEKLLRATPRKYAQLKITSRRCLTSRTSPSRSSGG